LDCFSARPRATIAEPPRLARNWSSDKRKLFWLRSAEIVAVATEGLRMADDADAFLGPANEALGIPIRLISGDEEAALMLRGVGEIEPGTLVLDIGGGSTELVTLHSRTSLDVGAVRLTERYLHSDPPTGDELEACAQYVRTVLPPLDATSAVGVAGTITTLAALDLGLDEYDRERVHGHQLSLAGVERQLERLAALPLEQRREVPALEPERAPVIVAGAVIAREVLAAYGLDAYRVSEHDILDGIALAAAELDEPVEGDAPTGAYTCC